MTECNLVALRILTTSFYYNKILFSCVFLDNFENKNKLMYHGPKKVSQANVIKPGHNRQSRPSLAPKTHKSEHQHQLSTTEGLDSVRSEIDEAKKTLEEATQFLQNATLLSDESTATDGIDFADLRSKIKQSTPNQLVETSVSGDLEKMLEELAQETGGNDPDIQQLKDVWDTTKLLSYQFEAVKKREPVNKNSPPSETK